MPPVHTRQFHAKTERRLELVQQRLLPLQFMRSITSAMSPQQCLPQPATSSVVPRVSASTKYECRELT